MLAKDLAYIKADEYADLDFAVNEVKKMLVGLHRTLAR